MEVVSIGAVDDPRYNSPVTGYASPADLGNAAAACATVLLNPCTLLDPVSDVCAVRFDIESAFAATYDSTQVYVGVRLE
jgi:hypothetical protein